jgi:uncharacterized heparinase superfamily protein
MSVNMPEKMVIHGVRTAAPAAAPPIARKRDPLPPPLVLWETVRHLRWRQIRHQLAFRLLPPRPLPPPLPLRWRRQRLKVQRTRNSRYVHFDGESLLRFNNESRAFAGDWSDPGARMLWLNNLNDMTWLFEVEPEGREAWIQRWTEANPPGGASAYWGPYAMSLRLFNWCKHYRLADGEPDAAVLRSMGAQAAGLLANLEYHLDANHLLENAFGLASVAFCLDPDDARAVRARARIGALLREQLEDQFLADGAHCELSPMYHAIALERLLDLLNAWPDREDPFPGLKARAEAIALQALEWLAVMSVGGRFSLFNDSAYDSAPDADLVLDYGARLLGFSPRPASPLRVLPDSGYYRAEAGPFAMIFDGGPMGPDHQMGHAQADMLSVCLWMREKPILVHPGIFEYLRGPMRDHNRSTAAHNTVAVAGCEQAEFWAAHRVGRRGRPRDVSAEAETGTGVGNVRVRIQGAHDGYARLPGRPLHRREALLGPRSLEVRDRLTADPGRPSGAYWHFHPECALEREGEAIRIRSSAGNLLLRADRPMRIEDSWYCPEYGLRIPNLAVRVECGGAGCTTLLAED